MVPSLLVVDDDRNQLELYQMELADEGYDVFVARDPDAAARVLLRCRIDLVVLDLMLDGVAAGADLLVQIAQRYPGLPVVVHTANANLQHGLVDFLTEAFVIKHSDLEELKRQIRSVLERSAPVGERAGGEFLEGTAVAGPY